MNRKSDILPRNLDAEQLGMIFERIREYPENPQSKRVEEILEMLSRWREGARSLEKAQVLARLNRLLSDYRWAFMASLSKQGLMTFPFAADRGRLSKDDQWGYAAIGTLLQLVPYLGKQSRIRRCANKECREWMFAGNNKKLFHSGTCRQRAYDSKPENRERKKKYSKDHRKQAKERALRHASEVKKPRR
jgi:hypothetical protein